MSQVVRLTDVTEGIVSLNALSSPGHSNLFEILVVNLKSGRRCVNGAVGSRN